MPTTTPTTETAVYIRLTRDESLQKGLSAPAQRADAKNYCERRNLGPVTFYEETKAVSGDTPFEKRKAGSQLLADIRAGKVRNLVVRDIDRLVRDVELWLFLANLLHQQACTLHTFSGEVALATPTDRLSANIRSLFAQFEKEQTGDRVVRAKRQLARTGRHVGGPAPFGFQTQATYRHQLIASGVDPEDAAFQSMTKFPVVGYLYTNQSEAEVVRLAFQLYVEEGLGSRAICAKLNAMGSRRRSGKPWHPDKLRRILSDPVVAGFIPFDLRYSEEQRGQRLRKSDQHLFKGTHEAIIDPEVWHKAQKIRVRNRNAQLNQGTSRNRSFPLSGVLVCGKCGSRMRSASVSANGRWGYFVCRNRWQYGPSGEYGCDAPRVRISKVDVAVFERLQQMLVRPGLADRMMQQAERMALVKRAPKRRTIDPSKLEADRAKWYRRHDNAKTEAEQEAAWARIVELTEQLKQIPDEEPEPAPLPKLTRANIEACLNSLAKKLRQSEGSKQLVDALVDAHQLSVRVLGQRQLEVSLVLSPALSLCESVEIPGDDLTEWAKSQVEPVCKTCGKPIKVLKRHRARGLPTIHHKCIGQYHAELRLKKALGGYTAIGAMAKLGIGRTTLGRWIRSGKLPAEIKDGQYVFAKAVVDRLTRKSGIPRKQC